MSIFAGVKERISRYLELHLDILKISVIGRTARVVSYLLFALIALLILFCIVLFIGFGLTNVFLDMGISAVGSFFLTTGVYVVLLILVVLLRRPITSFFADSLVEVMTTEEDEKDTNS